MTFDWLKYGIPCKNWCCHGERPFASKQELRRLDVTKIKATPAGNCMFLEPSGKCGVYSQRPLECRIFPFDIQELDGKLMWVI